jgi:ribosome-interacting GTPase 1
VSHTDFKSCELDLGVQDVVKIHWQELRLMKIHTKKKGEDPGFVETLGNDFGRDIWVSLPL